MTTKKYTSIIASLAFCTLALNVGVASNQADDSAPAAIFLAGDDARWIIGQVIICCWR
jgi:hypothetical protein